MSVPLSLHSNEYLEQLQSFRDSALVESHWSGRRRTIGDFTFGFARAHWSTEEGGTASLTEEGLRYRNNTLTKLKPTTLRLIHRLGNLGVEVVTFRMDIDDIGCIDVYRNMLTKGSLKENVLAELYRRTDRKHGLSEPTDEDRQLIYTEMERGASGLYPVIY